MNVFSSNPTFIAYAIACLVLCCNLLFLWLYSGATRSRVKSTPNAEDAARFGATLSQAEPPEITRVLRAHANAQATVYPFLVLGLIYVLAGGSFIPALFYFATFCVARLFHSYAYLAERQPWRTIWFVIGMSVTMILLIHTAWLIAAAR